MTHDEYNRAFSTAIAKLGECPHCHRSRLGRLPTWVCYEGSREAEKRERIAQARALLESHGYTADEPVSADWPMLSAERIDTAALRWIDSATSRHSR